MRTFYHSFTSQFPSYSFPVYEDEVKLEIKEITLEGFNANTTVIHITYLNGNHSVHSNSLQLPTGTKGKVFKTDTTYLIPEGISHIKISIGFSQSELDGFITLAWDIHVVP
jgi:hypothetical protein